MPKFKTKSKCVLITIIYLITFNCISVFYQNKYSDIFICIIFILFPWESLTKMVFPAFRVKTRIKIPCFSGEISFGE